MATVRRAPDDDGAPVVPFENVEQVQADLETRLSKEEIATRTFGCFETSHPYVERIMAQGEWLISGESMDFIEKIMWNDGID